MKKTTCNMKKLFLITVVLFVMGGCSYSNLDYVKERADQRWESMGFEVVGYDGFQWGVTYIHPSYGGAKVWHVLKRIPDNGIIYGGFLQRWGNEIHMYNVKAIDAIKP